MIPVGVAYLSAFHCYFSVFFSPKCTLEIEELPCNMYLSKHLHGVPVGTPRLPGVCFTPINSIPVGYYFIPGTRYYVLLRTRTAPRTDTDTWDDGRAHGRPPDPNPNPDPNAMV